MEMESSRRSAVDRSREPGLKKPRLVEEAERDRGSNGVSADRDRSFPPPRASGGSQSSNPPRFRATDRGRGEKEDSTREGSYQHQQELVAQYKTALAELTFNSKPIITNLTIIAGENLHAAKGIAAAICSNVLEVPSEQKLPSLYLLDSIVKNIGRDYIKYFAPKLPEVFCKAYKQVDSSIHPGMRHLFGTWKGVFPPAPLQIIEKELGFTSMVNGSSGTTTSRTDSQTHRPPHSIHVNPKYLEARQRLQQSSREKEVSTDDLSGVVTPIDDAERSDRTTIIGSTRKWTDLPSKMPDIQRPQRERPNDPIHEKKGYRDIRDHEFSSDLSQQSDLVIGRINEGVKERDELDKPYFGAGSAVSEPAASRRNGFDVNCAYGNYRASGFSKADNQLPPLHLDNINKSSRPTPKNWKNSEEEEYMWDDMNSKLTDYGGTNSSIKAGWNTDGVDKPASLQRGKWMPLESEQLDSQRNNFDKFSRLKTSGGEERVPLFRDIDEHLPRPHNQHDTDSRINMETSADPLSLGRAASGHHSSSVWPQREPPLSADGLNQTSSRVSGQSEGLPISLSGGLSTNLISSLPRPGLLSHSQPSSLGPFTTIVSGSIGTFGQQRKQPLHPPSSPAHSPPSVVPLQHQKLHNSIDHDHPQLHFFSQMGKKPMQLPAHLNRVPHATVTQDSFPILAQNHSQHSHTLHNLQLPLSQPSQPSSVPFSQLRYHPPFLPQSQPELLLQQTQTQSQQLFQTEKPPSSSQGFGTHQSRGYSGAIQSNNPVDVTGQSSTRNLLAAIMKSGLIPNNPASGLQNENIQPPLPSGPPPMQALTSSAPLVTPLSLILPTSQANTLALTQPPMGTMLPPLPPGPPPSSSLVSTSSQVSNTASGVPNPFSSLLSSLVAKGIISSPATEVPDVTSVQIPNKLPNLSSAFTSSNSVLVPSTSATSTILPSSMQELSTPEPSDPTGTTLLPPSTLELEDLIGFDFKPEIMRELHPLVISSLFDDLKHQCNVCGLRFKLQEQLDGHLDLHDSKNSNVSSFDEVSRKWYADISNVVAGSMEPPAILVPTTSLEEVIPTSEKCKPVVPADESQCICALCGEPFEDFYSHERDEWMYKGTVYLNLPERKGEMGGMNEIMGQVPIVHAECVSRSADNMEVAEHDLMGQADG